MGRNPFDDFRDSVEEAVEGTVDAARDAVDFLTDNTPIGLFPAAQAQDLLLEREIPFFEDIPFVGDLLGGKKKKDRLNPEAVIEARRAEFVKRKQNLLNRLNKLQALGETNVTLDTFSELKARTRDLDFVRPPADQLNTVLDAGNLADAVNMFADISGEGAFPKVSGLEEELEQALAGEGRFKERQLQRDSRALLRDMPGRAGVIFTR